MRKTLFLFSVLMGVFNLSYATNTIVLYSQNMQHEMKSLSNIDTFATKVDEAKLPPPYDYLLTQPLMTKGIETYYRRKPIIQTIYANTNKHNNTYSRAIIMLLDTNELRNDAVLARKKKEAVVVELAFITMNFKTLPQEVKQGVLTTTIPFGQLLVAHHVKTYPRDRHYFSVKCNKTLSLFTQCILDSTLYGRIQTLVRADDEQWVAQVIEILPPIPL